MELLRLDDDNEVVINLLWVRTNPKLNALITRDKGKREFPKDKPSYTDKPQAKKDFKLILLLLNPDSEYAEMEEDERESEALTLLEYKERDYLEDTVLQTAIEEYRKILQSIPSYRSYKSVKVSIDKKIIYVENINFTDTDKQGRLKVTALDHSKAVEGLHKDLKYLKEFEKAYREDYEDKSNRFKKSLTISSLEKSNSNSKEWKEDLNDL